MDRIFRVAGGVPPRWGLALIGNPAGYNHGAPMALLPDSLGLGQVVPGAALKMSNLNTILASRSSRSSV